MPPQKISPASSISPPFCFIDVETTGLDCHSHAVYNIGGIAVDRDGEEHPFDLWCQPHRGARINQEALKISGMTRERLHELPQAKDAYLQLLDILSDIVNPREKHDKFWFAGWNAPFDEDFLREWFLLTDPKYGKFFGSYFWWPPIDIAQEAALHYATQRHKFRNFHMSTVAEWMGLEVDENLLHSAFYDAELEMAIWKRIQEEKENA